ncbi:MAG: pentapeptide repeat-containing protein, partial [Oscillospiraceae bacterium]
MKVAKPLLPKQLEDGISLEEAFGMAALDDAAICGYAFNGGDAVAAPLEKQEISQCSFTACRLGSAELRRAWIRDTVFTRCDFENADFTDSTLH